MANHLGLSATEIVDLAVGGATTQDVLQLQVLPWLATVGTADPDALYVYWAGSNDFWLVDDLGVNPMISQAMQNTAASLMALIASGAETILVVNLFDWSLSPHVVAAGDPGLSAFVRKVTKKYNAKLAETVAEVEALTGIDILEVDAFALSQELIADPREGGFKVVDAPACSPEGDVVKKVDDHLWWDALHPTTRAHSQLVGAALASLGILWGDVDGDGALSGLDVAALAQAFGPCQPGCAADMDGDGTVDVDDLELLHLVLH
jgi:phospholipase/lecithinase/hemolysin